MRNAVLPLAAVFLIMAVSLSSQMAASQEVDVLDSTSDSTSDTTTYYYYDDGCALDVSPSSGLSVLFAIFAIASTITVGSRLVKVVGYRF
jgi:hypothetical protein